jgi:alkylation response protein AidB-like acyl-CoA dehydrogenase
MDFKLSAEQLLIKDSALRFAQNAPHADAWSTFTNLGWLGIGVPEEAGGFGGALERMLVAEALGRGLVLEPLTTCGFFPAAILSAARRFDLLERLCDGSERFAVAYEEEHARYDPSAITTIAERTADGYRLQGSKVRVAVPGSAATFLVSARTGERIGLFAITPGCTGVTRQDERTEDGSSATTLTLDGVVLDDAMLIGPPGEGRGLLQAGLDHAIGALCAEAVGVMSVMFDLTLAYLGERTQFGVPIGSFQALQHRTAEMFIELELARSMAYLAAMTLDSERDPDARSRAIAAAKIQIARSGRFVGQNAIQLHGAIAMTQEYKLGGYFKRMTSLERLYGDVDFHLERYLILTPFKDAARNRSSQIGQSTLERNASM